MNHHVNFVPKGRALPEDVWMWSYTEIWNIVDIGFIDLCTVNKIRQIIESNFYEMIILELIIFFYIFQFYFLLL